MGRCLGLALQPQEPLSPSLLPGSPVPHTQHHPGHPPAAAAPSAPAHAGARAGRWRRRARAAPSSARRPSLPTDHLETGRHLVRWPGTRQGKGEPGQAALTLPLGSHMTLWEQVPCGHTGGGQPALRKPYLRYLPVVHLHERVHLNPQGLGVQHGVRVLAQPLWGKRCPQARRSGPTPGPARPAGIILHGLRAWRLWPRVQEIRKILVVARTYHPECQDQVSACCSQGR